MMFFDTYSKSTFDWIPYFLGIISDDATLQILREDHSFAVSEFASSSKSLMSGLDGKGVVILLQVPSLHVREMNFGIPSEMVVHDPVCGSGGFIMNALPSVLSPSLSLLGYGITSQDPYFTGEGVFKHRLEFEFTALINPGGIVPGIPLNEPEIANAQHEQHFCTDHMSIGRRVIEFLGTPDSLLNGDGHVHMQREGEHVSVVTWTPDFIRWEEAECRILINAFMQMHLSLLKNKVPDLPQTLGFLISEFPNKAKRTIKTALQHANAFIVELGLQPLPDLSPLRNCNGMDLPGFVFEWIDAHPEYESLMTEFLSSRDENIELPLDPLDVFQDPPPRSPNDTSTNARQGFRTSSGSHGRRDAEKRVLGLRGEKFVIRAERIRLERAGRSDFAENLEHVSVRRGDGAGYDVLSFNEDGTPMHIEVKTTNGGKRQPFLMSENERRFSNLHSDTYCIYRVYDFPRRPRIYVVKGSVNEHFILEPNEYRVRR